MRFKEGMCYTEPNEFPEQMVGKGQIWMWKRLGCAMLLMCGLAVCGASCAESLTPAQAAMWNMGFGAQQIEPDASGNQPLYIAGYNNGWEITGVLDACEARAVWLDAGGEGALFIGVDCIALASGTAEQIRESLADIPGCAAINVYATHTHAGPDTLGLWGPIGTDGKNQSYMDALVRAAEAAARAAAADRRPGTLHFGQIQTQNMYRDSRLPEVYDDWLYQLRFSPSDGSAGIRWFFYGAHAESLRGDNTLLSRDFPGLLCDGVTRETGDRTLFAPGPIGGLIMTKAFVEDTSRFAVENLTITAEKLLQYALAIAPETERTLAPELAFSRQSFVVPLDNPAFLMYKQLGILNNQAVEAESATGYGVQTELSVWKLGELAMTLIPGEIFPELVSGSAYGDANPSGVNPRPLAQIAQENGLSEMLIIGLANDELGYIVPPSDFLLNKENPYLDRTMDSKGEDHYEETNSVGPDCAALVAAAFETAVKELQRLP